MTNLHLASKHNFVLSKKVAKTLLKGFQPALATFVKEFACGRR
jgi:hypothetical protein